MGPEENNSVVRRFVEEIPNKKNSVPADELLTSGFVLHFPNMPAVEGIEAFKEIPTAILSAFPDLVETIDDLVAEGDHVVERMTLRGTHLGEFMGVAPHREVGLVDRDRHLPSGGGADRRVLGRAEPPRSRAADGSGFAASWAVGLTPDQGLGKLTSSIRSQPQDPLCGPQSRRAWHGGCRRLA